MIHLTPFTIKDIKYVQVENSHEGKSKSFDRLRVEVPGVEWCGTNHPMEVEVRQEALNTLISEARGGRKIKRSQVKVNKEEYQKRVQARLKEFKAQPGIGTHPGDQPPISLLASIGNEKIGFFMLYDIKHVQTTDLELHITGTPAPMFDNLNVGTDAWIAVASDIYGYLLTSSLQQKKSKLKVKINAFDMPIVKLPGFDYKNFLPKWESALTSQGLVLTKDTSNRFGEDTNFISRIAAR